MFESLGAALQVVRDSGPRIVAVVALVSGALLFLPATIIETLGLDKFLVEQRANIGLVFIAAVAIITVDIVRWTMARLNARRTKKQLENVRSHVLATLTSEERKYLAPYILEGENTCYYGIDDGVAGGLKSKGVLYIGSNIGNLVNGIAFNLQPWAREALSSKPEMFQGITHRPPTPRDRFFNSW